MHQRLATRDRNHRRATLVDRIEAFIRRELPLQDVRRILNLSATCARQIAAEERLEHQHQRILLAPSQLLPDHVRSHRPHLRDRYTHASDRSPPGMLTWPTPISPSPAS